MCKKTNPSARLVFLGDEKNEGVAKRSGWEHYKFEEFEGTYQAKFNEVFRHINGRKHNNIKNGRDWLKYVFERWMFIDGFCEKNNIKRFWHFDSDTMILEPLSNHSKKLADYDFTVQCNGTCLNGIVNANVVKDFCKFICEIFEDNEYMQTQQNEFNTINPDYAFTEMRAFDEYKKKTLKKWMHLLYYSDNEVFDDALCQDHGFEVIQLPIGKTVKKIKSKNQTIYGTRDNEEIKFITLNLSWLPDCFFEWTLEAIDNKYIYKNIEDIRYPIQERIKGILRKIRNNIAGKTKIILNE